MKWQIFPVGLIQYYSGKQDDRTVWQDGEILASGTDRSWGQAALAMEFSCARTAIFFWLHTQSQDVWLSSEALDYPIFFYKILFCLKYLERILWLATKIFFSHRL